MSKYCIYKKQRVFVDVTIFIDLTYFGYRLQWAGLGKRVMENTKFKTQLSFVVLNPQFNLLVKINQNDTNIFMTVGPECFTTKSYPATYAVLEKRIPGVLRTKCFNDNNNPFSVEVLDTELGHLFEHILIQKISEIRQAQGLPCKKYRGETYWDWYRFTEGSFHITISADYHEAEIIEEAVLFSNDVMSEIFETSKVEASEESNDVPASVNQREQKD